MEKLENACKIVHANALDYLKQMDDESVDCVVTSPPYYGLRSYEGADTVWGGDPKCEHNFSNSNAYFDNLRYRAGSKTSVGNNKKKEIFTGPEVNYAFCEKCGAWYGQLGLEPTVDMFIDHLLLITKEIKRVLKKTGTFFLNINDTYSGSRCGRGDNTLFQNTRRKYMADQIYNKPSPQAHSRIPEKSLMLVPERLTIRMVDEQGWILRNKIIWSKPNALPSSAKDRFTNKWEYVFFFVKSRKYYFDLDAVRVPLKTNYKSFNYHVREAIMGRLNQKFGSMYSASEEEKTQYDRHGVRVYNSKYSLDMYLSPQDPIYLKQKLVRVASREVAKELFPNDQEKQQEIVNFVHDHYSNPKGANPGDVCQVNTKAHKFAHFAVFPEALVEPLIKAGCPENGVVLDPFAGSGTTGVVAKKLNRNAILIEISEKYVEIIKQRLASIL
jgi:DNA modification methylase